MIDLYYCGTPDRFSMPDIACYPWIVPHEGDGQDLNTLPHLKRWCESMASRPATLRAYGDAKGPYAHTTAPLSDAERSNLFGARR